MTATNGDDFELLIDDAGRIASISGPVPEEEGAEFEIEGPLPAHASVDAPAHIKDLAAGREVCHYDPVGCLTCYCDGDGNRLYCKRMC